MQPDQRVVITTTIHERTDGPRVSALAKRDHRPDSLFSATVAHCPVNQVVNSACPWQGIIPFINRSFCYHTHSSPTKSVVRDQYLFRRRTGRKFPLGITLQK